MAVTIGTKVVVDASGAGPLGVAKLSSSLSIVIYEKSGSLKARTISIATPPTINAEVNIDTVSARAVIAALDATTAMVVYYDGANAEARILSVSGTTITVQSPTTLTHSSFTAPDIATIDSTNVLFTYSTVGSSKAVVLSVSGTTITENTIIEFEAATTQANKCAVFSSTKSINTWYDGSAFQGIIIDISGTTLTANTKKTIRTFAAHTNDYSSFCIKMTSSLAVWGGSDSAGVSFFSRYNALSLSGVTFNIGANFNDGGSGNHDGISAARVIDTRFILYRKIGFTTYEASTLDLSGTTLDNSSVALTSSAGAINWIKCAPIDGTRIIAHFKSSSSVALLTDATGSHIWLSTDGGATYTDIGDTATWDADLVGGVVVVPGTAYQTIFAAVGTNLYKTVDGGTNWTLETAVGYEVDFIDLEKDNTTVFLAKRDAAGTNRASLWDSVGASLTHINTGKSTTGGATSGSDVA